MATPATPLANGKNLKCPDLKLGQRVIPGDKWMRDFPFYKKQYALYLIKKFRETQPSLAKYLGTQKTGGRLPPGIKKEIRECLKLFSEAIIFEVAGIFVTHGFNLDNSGFNACYLAGVRGAASPPTYGVQLLIRFKKDGNELALIVGYGVNANSLKPV